MIPKFMLISLLCLTGCGVRHEIIHESAIGMSPSNSFVPSAMYYDQVLLADYWKEKYEQSEKIWKIRMDIKELEILEVKNSKGGWIDWEKVPLLEK